jgi:hypothetical protein
MGECRIVATTAHQRNHENIVIIDIKVDDVRKPLEAAWPKSVCSNSEQKRIVADALNRRQVFE